jgi:hypothetical protein
MKVTFSSIDKKHLESSFSVALPMPTQEQIKALEVQLGELPQIDLNTTHSLMNGMYVRSIFIPKGCALVGAQHKTDHINIVSGDIMVTTDEGTKRLTGYNVITTKAGLQRAGVALEDTYWSTITRTAFDSLDRLADIEDELTPDADRLQTRMRLN